MTRGESDGRRTVSHDLSFPTPTPADLGVRREAPVPRPLPSFWKSLDVKTRIKLSEIGGCGRWTMTG
ncbi:hypothetical protein R1flu_009274 [Riccia fluitans]|uniref:Uncharacterized protein n=1 Tax=Riccia fluitans TaxID=41844 RepID=A0ABD1Z5S0_9MARC